MARKSYKQKYNSEDGVWRTIGGRRVFIRHGQSLSDAMKESGKFKNLKREDVVKGRAELQREESTERAEWFKRREKASTKKREQKDYHDRWNETTKETKEAKELLDIYGNPKEYPGILSDLEGKHMLGNKYRKLENDYSDLSWKMQDSDYYYKPEDDRKLQKLRADADMERLKLGIDTQDKYDNMMYKKNMYYNNNEMPAYKDPYVQKQVGIDTAKAFGAKSVTINGEKIDLSDGSKKEYNPFVTDDERVSVVGKKDFNNGKGFIGYDKENNAYHNAYKSRDGKDVNTSGPYRTFEEAERDLDNTYSVKGKTPYNSKAYAKELSQVYMAEEEYDDKITPKYIQDIDAGRYGNMSDEEAIKNWIDGGADLVYVSDTETKLKEWGIKVKNDDPYGTYRDELAKQLLPIYKEDKRVLGLKQRFQGTYENLKENTNMSEAEILEFLKKLQNK